MARHRDTWYRLDNVGKFYSAQVAGSVQTVFRFSAELADEVDPRALQRALDRAVELYPGFNVCLRSGLFWHYLQQAPGSPTVQPEVLPVCYGLHVDAKSVLFRVSHYRRRVNLEVSHIVSDGRGTLGLFKALISRYVEERYGVEGVQIEASTSGARQTENSFDANYEPDRAGSTSLPRPYHITGWRDPADPTFMELHLPLHPALDLARSMGASLTSLLIAVAMVSIRAQMARRDRRRAICVDVPVDLRPHFASETAKNFFGLAFATHVPGASDVAVEDLARDVNAQLRIATEPDQLKRRMNRMVALEKNPLLRVAPLFLKDWVLAVIDRLVANDTTTTVSNLGAIRLDDKVARYVRTINVLTSATGLKFTACSFGDDLSIGVTSCFSNTDVVRYFCRFFTSRGVAVHANVSKTSDEVAQDQVEAAFDASVRRLGEKAADRVNGAAVRRACENGGRR